MAGNAAAEQLLGPHVLGRRLPWNDADPESVADHRLDDLDVLGLHDDLRLDPLPREEFLDQPPRDRSGLEQHEVLLVEVGRRDRLLLGEGVRRVGDQQQLLLQHRHRDRVGRFHR